MSLTLVHSLEELRSRIAPARPREALPFSLVSGGIPKSAITELSGPHGAGKTEAVLRFLAENPTIRAAWIEEELTAYPRAFPQAGVGLKRILFVEAGKFALWAALQIIRSRSFKAVVLHAEKIEELELRRLQLAARDAGTSVIMLREKPVEHGAWPISLRVKVERSCELRVF
jgi:hypothetical protein